MRYTYIVTKKCCPVCGTVLESDSPVGGYILGFLLLPFIVFSIPFFIARWVLKNFVLCVDVPRVSEHAHVCCPKCGTIVRINNNPTYDIAIYLRHPVHHKWMTKIDCNMITVDYSEWHIFWGEC